MEVCDICPTCGAWVKIELSCTALSKRATSPPQEWLLDQDGYEITLRPLNSVDAALAAQQLDVESARATLLSRCVVAVAVDGKPQPLDALPTELVASIAASLAEHDTGAELMLELNCPECGRAWSSVLDVASFVWTEIAARAKRLVAEVHTLARAYGWREADILAMTDARRAVYLSMVNA